MRQLFVEISNQNQLNGAHDFGYFKHYFRAMVLYLQRLSYPARICYYL